MINLEREAQIRIKTRALALKYDNWNSLADRLENEFGTLSNDDREVAFSIYREECLVKNFLARNRQ